MIRMPPRTLRTEREYRRYLRQAGDACGYCIVRDSPTEQLIATHGTMMVLNNRFPYVRWDGWKVGSHRLLVPKRHVAALSEFSAEETKDLNELMVEYDAAGY